MSTPGASTARAQSTAEWTPARICSAIEAAAREYDLPSAFFARLIWTESRFDTAALSPKGAQGIAQFMPGTAKLEGLSDPFDPHLAIPASAKHLADLRGEFGNLGLAAAAYNSGRNRVARWLAGASGLPWETLDYVQSITARPADWFRDSGREVEDRPLDETLSFGAGCRKLPIMKTRAVFAGASVPPWGAQVAGGISHAAAHQAFARARRANPGLIGGEPLILRNRRGAGPRFSARIGHPDRGAALAFCRRLTARGSPCTVQRN